MSWLRKAAMMLAVYAVGSIAVFAQTKSVSGTVVDDLGEPILGANVVIVGTTTGATTDMDGNFTLSGVPENGQLKVTFIGYTEQIVPVAGQKTIKVTLKEDVAQLEDVVVIGYGTVKRRDLTGSVASIKGDQLKANPVANVAQALQGMMPGVSVTAQDGRPGATMNVRIRGGNSITQSNDPIYIVDGVQVSDISDLAADNIESMDVLKDAASTAIYGARGANGVILITTKGAKAGKCVVRYGMYYQSKKAANELEVQDAQDYLYWNWAYAQDYGFTAGQTAANQYGSSLGQAVARTFGLGSAYGNHYADYANVSSHNYVDDLLRTASAWNHDVSVSGGTEKTKVTASLNYLNDEGIRVLSGYKRISANAKLEQKINKKLSVDFDIRYYERTLEGTKFDMATSAYRFRPIDNPLGDGDINNGWGNASPNVDEAYNPVDILNNYTNKEKKYGIRNRAGLTWDIIKGLKLRSEFSLSRNWSETKYWNGGQDPNSTAYSQAKHTQGNGYGVRMVNTLTYEVPGLGEANNLTVMVGEELMVSKSNKTVFTGYGYPSGFTFSDAFARLNETGYASNTSGMDTYEVSVGERVKTSSLFGRINYSYKGRYLASFTMRADGSNKFGEGNRWGYFPSGALAWRLSDEAFMEDAKDVVDNLKLRVSYGTTGADNISSGLWRDRWTSKYVTVDGVKQKTWTQSDMMPNPDLKWETTTSRNLGLDFSIANGIVHGSIETYWNSTEDLLMKVPVSQNSGYTYQMQNVAETSNKGFEVNLNYDILRTADWTVGVSLNYNYNKNNIEAINADVQASAHTGWGSSMRIPNYDYIVEEGRPVGVIQGFKSCGYYTVDDFNYNAANGTYTLKEGIPDARLLNYSSGVSSLADNTNIMSDGEAQRAFPGAAKFEDVNGDGFIDENDCTVLAETKAKHNGGFNINAKYKWIDMSMGFTYQIGGNVYNANAMHSMMGNKDNSLGQNRLSIVSDCFKNYQVNAAGDLELVTDPDVLRSINSGTKYACAFAEYGVVSSEFIEDASYLRLNTLTVGYTVPVKFTKKVGISNARIYFTGGNLFCLTGYSGLDPEVSVDEDASDTGFPTPNYDYCAYPKARTFTFGMNVTF